MNIHKILNIFLNLCIIVTGFLLIVVICFTADQLSDSSVYANPYSRSSFTYAAGNQDYERLLSMYRDNLTSFGQPSEDLSDYYALAQYVEAAINRKAYLEAGDTERAEREQNIMNNAAAALGDLSGYKDNLDKTLTGK